MSAYLSVKCTDLVSRNGIARTADMASESSAFASSDPPTSTVTVLKSQWKTGSCFSHCFHILKSCAEGKQTFYGGTKDKK